MDESPQQPRQDTTLHSPRIVPCFENLGHLALWAGLYVTGAMVFLVQLSGFAAEVSAGSLARAAAFCFCTATGVYLLDRAKVRDAWFDPPDAQAHPARHAFLRNNAARVRLLMLLLLAAASGLGAGLLPWGACAPPLAAIGVFLYAGRPRARRPRPKDVVLVKNAYVAGGITGFAAVAAVAAASPAGDVRSLRDIALAHAAALGIAGLLLAARVFADAILCDLDDAAADSAHGTSTLPVRLGRPRAWNVATAIRLLSAAALVALPQLPLPARISWAIITVISSALPRILRPARMRDWVDARLALEAVAVGAILAIRATSAQ